MMVTTMNQDKIRALALELAKDLKTTADFSVFSAQLTKIAVEAALNAELDVHLGYASNALAGATVALVATVAPLNHSKTITVKLLSTRHVTAMPVLNRCFSSKVKRASLPWTSRFYVSMQRV